MLFKKVCHGIMSLLCLGRGTIAVIFWGGGGGQGFVDDCLMCFWGKA